MDDGEASSRDDCSKYPWIALPATSEAPSARRLLALEFYRALSVARSYPDLTRAGALSLRQSTEASAFVGRESVWIQELLSNEAAAVPFHVLLGDAPRGARLGRLAREPVFGLRLDGGAARCYVQDRAVDAARPKRARTG